MYEILPETDGDLLAVRLSGTLSETHYRRMAPWLDRAIALGAQPGVMLLMDNFRGWAGPAPTWGELRSGVPHHSEVDRVAMVGEPRWQVSMTRISNPFLGAEVRYFDPAQRQAAERWARGSRLRHRQGASHRD